MNYHNICGFQKNVKKVQAQFKLKQDQISHQTNIITTADYMQARSFLNIKF